MSATLGSITPHDLGRKVRVETGDTSIVGWLDDYDVHTDWITEPTLAQEHPTRIPGRRTMTVTVGAWTASRLPLETKVEFL